MTVLIVDGHERARSALVQRLQRMQGVTVLAAVGDEGTAVRLIRELAPDVVLLEPKTMAGNPGVALRWLAGTGRPVVIWTSSLVDGEAEALKRDGAAAVLLKDTNLPGLLRALETAIAAR